MGSAVGDNFVIKAEAKVYFVKKERGNAFGGDVFLCGTENHPLSKPMVDHDQKGIEAGGRGEVCDKVTGDLLERAGRGGVNGGERRDGGVCICFVLLAGGAALNVFADIGGKTGPPEFRCNELSSLKVAVTSTLMVMATLENSVTEGVIVGDVNTTLVGQDARFDLPIGKAGTEGEGNVVVHGLEGLKDEGVARQSRLDAMGEGNVDNIDEERWGKEGNAIVVIIGLGKEVWATREGVRAGEEFSRNMDHFQVKICEVDEPVGLLAVEVLGETEIGEVFMVGEDLDWEGGSVEVVPP